MNHPKHEEWVPYLDGEASPETQKRLSVHLQSCPECAAEVAGWQRSIGRLDRWKLPPLRRSRPEWLEPALKWGIAAALVLGMGFGIGRWSATAHDTAGLREELQAALAANRAQISNELQAQLTNASSQALAGAAEVSSVESRRLFGEFVKVLNEARAEDQQTMLAQLDRLQQRHAADYVALRKDLETVAAFADDEIRRTRQGLRHFAADNTSVRDTNQP
ncbi:MAG TPA: zf-HC2 domain-containing protein [Verrucomicrobiae bacterium]|nr:zf-HC2 domain-containing protein [Verrucomicrobiae bacterium]